MIARSAVIAAIPGQSSPGPTPTFTASWNSLLGEESTSQLQHGVHDTFEDGHSVAGLAIIARSDGRTLSHDQCE